MRFFADYGAVGVAGLVVAGAVFGLTGWAVLDICFRNHISGHSELLQHLMGKRVGLAAEFTVGFFMCVLYAAMLAGAGATLKQAFNLPFSYGVLAASILTFVALLFDLKGLVAVNARIAPFLIVGGMLIGFMTFVEQARPAFAGIKTGWVVSALIYASYNIVTSISVLAALSPMIKDRKSAAKAGLLSGGIMTVVGLCMIYPLYLHYHNVQYSEIPLLEVTQRLGHGVQIVYMFLLLGARFSTAVSNGFAIVQWFTDRLSFKPLTAKVIIAIGGVLAAHVGFSMFVSHVYPLFSLVGIMETIVLLAVFVKEHKKLDKRRRIE
jgi:uncharacterized membrane protein YkvI